MNLKFYTALDVHDLGIITVMANSVNEAKEQIKEQLQRPGRTIYQSKWVKTVRRLSHTDREEVVAKPLWRRGDITYSSPEILAVLENGGVFYVDDE